jgi:ABC-type transport system substrate-binding protein
MKRFGLRFLVASSLLVTSAFPATRARYGGTLHVTVRSSPMTIDPIDSAPVLAIRNISRLLFDTLVVLDVSGRAQPSLAMSWQSDPGNQRWQFSLRHAVTFSDGTPLTADAVAASLRAVNSSWHVLPAGDAVMIQIDSPDVDLPSELALPRYGIIRRDNRKLTGTGPFIIAQWQPGKKLSLTARNDYWNGRPFVDSIDIELSGGTAASYDFGKYQLAEIAPEQARRAVGTGRKVESSAPAELLALAFTQARRSADEGRLRDALSLSIDRRAVSDVLLQGGGEPARGLLPNWMTGYGFLFSSETNLPLAHQVVTEAKQVASWTLGYDANDPAARVLAERIALNAHDSGINLLPTNNATPDIRLVRLNLASIDPHVALAQLATDLGLPAPKFTSSSSEEMYAAERSLLQSQRVIPLVHLRATFGVADSVANWNNSRNGDWHLADVWLGPEKP